VVKDSVLTWQDDWRISRHEGLLNLGIVVLIATNIRCGVHVSSACLSFLEMQCCEYVRAAVGAHISLASSKLRLALWRLLDCQIRCCG
jgi:hypothetical protein